MEEEYELWHDKLKLVMSIYFPSLEVTEIYSRALYNEGATVYEAVLRVHSMAKQFNLPIGDSN